MQDISENSLFLNDIKDASGHSFINWDRLSNAGILVTGATGIIGYAVVSLLLCANREKGLNARIYALTRNKSGAEAVFEQYRECFGKSLCFVEGSIEDDIDTSGIDYVIHGAAVTASKAFVDNPVETLETGIGGTANILRLFKDVPVKKIAFLSTMEVYGYPERGHKVTEDEIGTFSVTETRSSYPVGKIAAEMMCMAYCREYAVPVNILRLTQTIGPNIKADDKRFFAFLLDCVRGKKDIVLKSRGETERSYLYSVDAATAILTALTCDESGEIYNVANEELYCSIKEFSEKLCRKYGIGLRIEVDENSGSGFAGTLFMDLDTKKLRKLGWEPTPLTIEDIYDRLI